MSKLTKKTGKLSVKKQETLKKLINEYNIPQNQLPNNPEELGKFVTDFLNEKKTDLIEILDEKKAPKYRQAGHYVDQKLVPVPQPQFTIFDAIQDSAIKGKIKKYEIDDIGINLEPNEDKLIIALQQLLHQKSHHHDQTSKEFYSGNAGKDLIAYGKGESCSPRLKIKPSELYKAYFGKDNYSGSGAAHVKAVLTSLADKKFLIALNRKRVVKDKQGKAQVVTDRIEEVQSLIRVVNFYEGLTDEELELVKNDKLENAPNRGDLIIGLNPILIDQINTKYVEYPIDINKRMNLAAGGARRVTQAMTKLRDLMLRELSSKRTSVEYNEETLLKILRLDNYLKSRKRKRATERLEIAINAIVKLKLIQSYSLTVGAAGQNKYLFEINPDFL